MLVVWRSNGGFWLFSDFLTGVPERPLCDPIADVRESTLEWPFWVDSGLSNSRISTPANFRIWLSLLKKSAVERFSGVRL
jgi:hypothetical protein